MEKKLAVVVGAGKGMGVNIAKVFGMHDFKVAMLARNLDKLEPLTDELKTRGKEDTPQQMERFKKEEALFRSRWQASLDAGDPFYHPLMTLDNSKGLLRGYKVPEDEPEDETGFDPEEWV